MRRTTVNTDNAVIYESFSMDVSQTPNAECCKAFNHILEPNILKKAL